jgi:peptidoglycan hydrolase-like amidase
LSKFTSIASRRVVALAAAVAGVVGAAAPPAQAALPAAPPRALPASSVPATLDIAGHGYGHGIGLGQYGAYGYALQGWTYQQILAHYYGGTVPASTSVSTINVSLSELSGDATLAVSALPGQTLVVDGQNTNQTSLTLVRGQTVASTGGASVVVSGPWSGGSRWYPGTIALPAGSAQVINTVSLVQYVEGVVPRESPASWPAAELEAQAVAARTYALAYLGLYGTSAICDTSACQNYGGDPAQPAYGNSDWQQSDQAVTTTGGEVLECAESGPCGAAGALAFTEYSASTGGYSAGYQFPAVLDAGDNPSTDPYYYSWTASVAVSTVEATWPQLGTLTAIEITSRNGYGDYGGRVLSMHLVGSSSTVQLTGAQFAGALGLDSDWFDITNLIGTPPPGSDPGYRVAGADGSVFAYGTSGDFGSMAGVALRRPVVGLAGTPDGGGYWMAAADGGVFTFGDAHFYGTAATLPLAAPVVGMAPTSNGDGYWLVGSDGGVFTYGDAAFFGSAVPYHPAAPIVGMAATPDGRGYWLVGSDGGVFTFGDAAFFGSAVPYHPAAPIVAIVPSPDGRGYWLIGSDGGVFTFGDAGFHGSGVGSGMTGFVGAVATPDGGGYVLVDGAGQTYALGDGTWLGDPAESDPTWPGPVAAIAG